MKESDLTSNLLLKLRKINNTWWYKIPDPSRCAACGMIAIASKRPFDVVGVVNGQAIAMEIKRSAGIPLAPHQLAQLRMFTIAGGVAYKLEKHEVFMLDPDGTLTHFSHSPADIVKYCQLP